MRRKKPDAPITKRVDHDAGRHRPSRALNEPAICEECRAVYVNRRWTVADSFLENKQKQSQRLHSTLCPACAQQRKGEPRGFVFLDGAFIVTHHEEIEQLLQNEADRAAADNPLARIMKWQRGQRHHLTVTYDHGTSGPTIRSCA